MWGRKRKKIKPLKVIVKDNREDDRKENVETVGPQGWSELPHELLELILSLLKLGDNVRASAVCKSWSSAACAVRLFNQSPWIMHLRKSWGLFEFYDPTNRKTHFVDLFELANSRACYTKDGWLLLYKIEAQSIFFFNPFTRELINLPKMLMKNPPVAFSAAPTSGDCIVFIVKYVSPDIVTLSTCHPGATEWTSVNHQNHHSFVNGIWNDYKLVFCKGKFYCYNFTSWLGIYDSLGCTWDVISLLPPKCPESLFAKNWWSFRFMAEYDGEIFIIYTCSKENPILYKLDQANMSWKVMKTLDGGTFFISFLTSHSRVDLLGLRRNSIYFPKVRFYGKRCIFYSLDEHRCYPQKQCPDLKEENPLESIWIEPPRVFTGFT